jgi:hypothetical protein
MANRGEWSRWGRGMCEGYSLEIGFAIRGSVVRRHAVGLPSTWLASLNMTALGEFLDRGEAMRRVETRIEADMDLLLSDWADYRAVKAKR